MRRFLTLAALFVLVSEPAWAQGFFQYGSPYPGQYYRLPPYPYFTPPPRAYRRASPKPANVKIPQPEKATIGEQYAKGSIGGAVSHGCFRMHNTHIVELYEKVQVGANVYVVP